MPYLKIVIGIIFIAMSAGCARVPVVSPPEETVSAVKKEAGVYHKVVKGETLWRISKDSGVELEKIVSVNNLSAAERIEVGQVIFIPSEGRPKETASPLSAYLYSKEDFVWPIRGKVMLSFGEKRGVMPNKGIDIQAKEGAIIVASRSGKVIFSEDKVKGYGKTVIIDHGDGFQTVYAHNSEILVKIGEDVKQSAPIAKIGSSGRIKIPYLHFEIRKRHAPQNPFHYLP